jgi:hypothetical protein
MRVLEHEEEERGVRNIDESSTYPSKGLRAPETRSLDIGCKIESFIGSDERQVFTSAANWDSFCSTQSVSPYPLSLLFRLTTWRMYHYSLLCRGFLSRPLMLASVTYGYIRATIERMLMLSRSEAIRAIM